jgi:hypothetical protein
VQVPPSHRPNSRHAVTSSRLIAAASPHGYDLCYLSSGGTLETLHHIALYLSRCQTVRSDAIIKLSSLTEFGAGTPTSGLDVATTRRAFSGRRVPSTLTRYRKMSGSNPGIHTDCLQRSDSDFIGSYTQIPGQHLSSGHVRFLPHLSYSMFTATE